MAIQRLTDTEYIPLASIVVGKRLREKTPDVINHIEALAESLKLCGPITPLLVTDDPDAPELIAGGCRYEAYKLLGEEDVPVARRSNITPSKLRQLEVEENIRRRRMRWQEIVMGIYEVHQDGKQRASKHGEDWGVRATGSVVKQSHGYTAEALKIAEYLLRGDKEVTEAKSLEDAKKIILARFEAQIVAARAAKSGSVLIVRPEASPPRASGAITLELGAPVGTPTTVKEAVDAQPSSDSLMPRKIVPLSSMLHRADSTEWMKSVCPPDSIDLIVTDIPYGVDLDLMENIEGINAMRSTHDVEQNVLQMQPFLEGAHRVLKNNSYLLFFYAFQHHEKLRDWGEAAGFSVQPWPLLWLKPHSCKNNAPHCNWTKSIEPVMVMRKGKAVLARPQNRCHYECDGMPDKKLQSNPFAKPLEFLNWMLDPIVTPGMTVLDPFAGEGSILRAAILRGCRPIGVEIDEARFPRLQLRIKDVFSNLLGKDVEFT